MCTARMQMTLLVMTQSVPQPCQILSICPASSLLFIPPPSPARLSPGPLQGSPTCPCPTSPLVTNTCCRLQQDGVSWRKETVAFTALCPGFPRSCVPHPLALIHFLLLTVLHFVCSLAIMLCPFISAQGHFKDSGKKSFTS